MENTTAPMTKSLALCQNRGNDTIQARFLSAVEDKKFKIKGDILTTTLQELSPFVNDTMVSNIEVNITVQYNCSFVSRDSISKVSRFPKFETPIETKPLPLVQDKTIQPSVYKLSQQ